MNTTIIDKILIHMLDMEHSQIIYSDQFIDLIEGTTEYYDKKIEKAINGDKIYSITISSKCYIVDEITGEIQDYSFEDMDEYQTYEYFEDEEKMIICITENINKQLDDKEIMKSVIDLLYEKV